MYQAVADVLRGRRVEGWLVGGSVRDRELGRYSPDLDLVVAGDAAAVAAEVAGTLSVPWFALSERHPAYRVMGRQAHVDIAALRGDSILDDLGERDFTVNAMAVPVGGGGLIDPFGGLTHLRQGRLVAVSERIFADDPLRLMRAPRFSHVLGLHPDAPLAGAIRTQAPLLAGVAVERVVTEMALSFAAGRAADAVRLWHDLGLLDVVLPEVLLSGRLESTLALLEALDDLIDGLPAWFPATAGLLTERLARPVDGAVARPVALRLAGLMHRLAAREAETAGRRLKLSGDMVSLLRTVARHFSEGSALPAAPTDRAAVLFLWETSPWEPEVVALVAAAAPQRRRLAQKMMVAWGERELHGIPRSPLDGETLMRELGLRGGPLLGKVVREVQLAWEAGEATTVGEALGVARDALGGA
jgi:poly(A) polymerase